MTWGSMEFTYTGASDGVWNPDTHSFDGAVEAGWTHEENANKISVVNHSNAPVRVDMTANLNDGISCCFTDAESAEITFAQLSSAVGTEVGNAPSADIFFNITDGSVEESGKIGTVTIGLSGQ